MTEIPQGYASRYLGAPGVGGFKEAEFVAFIARKIEESMTLDYKDISLADRPSDLSRIITAMANAEGGLVVVGVREEREKDEKGKWVRIFPGEITWGGKGLSKETLEQRLISRVMPWIDGLAIIPIRNPTGGVVFLIDVPKSPRPPHQADDKKYYLRYNFENLPMDHSQVEALFNKRQRPKLLPLVQVTLIEPVIGSQDIWMVNIRFGLANTGGALAKFPMLSCQFHHFESVAHHTSYESFAVGPELTDSQNTSLHFQSADRVIHPDLALQVGVVQVRMKRWGRLLLVVGCEDMPTERSHCSFSAKYILDERQKAPQGSVGLFLLTSKSGQSDGADLKYRQLGAFADVDVTRVKEAAAKGTAELESVLDTL